MTQPDPAVIAAAISELANALQVAAPVSARVRELADALTQDAERLKAALERAMQAMRTLQPHIGGAE